MQVGRWISFPLPTASRKDNMEDRRAEKNTFHQGIALDEQPDTHLPAEEGVVPEFRGVPVVSESYIEAQTELTGIPMTGPGMQEDEAYSPPKCSGITKKGNPCRAYAISKGVFCVGHMTVKNK